jgi:guanine deaminase
MKSHRDYLLEAVELSKKSLTESDGGPFGCVIVKNGEVIGRGYNRVIAQNDPTAHAEVNAIREACAQLNHFQLDDCIIYASSEPCPMCFGAIYWARPKAIYFANTHQQAADIGFDDHFILQEVNLKPSERSIPTIHMPLEEASNVFDEWFAKNDRLKY